MMMTSEEFNQFVDAARQSDAREVCIILDRCNEVLPLLREDRIYKKFSNQFSLVQGLVDAQYLMFHGHESVTKMWLSVLKHLTATRDINILLMQLAVFLISQEKNYHRIDDDTLRLFATYVHIRIVKSLLEEEP